jgi:hypothetical protein
MVDSSRVFLKGWLLDALQKGVQFVWTDDHQKAFESLKMAQCEVPVLQIKAVAVKKLVVGLVTHAVGSPPVGF